MGGKPARKSSKKQDAVLAFLREAPTITLDQAVAVIGRNLYANAKFHVGNVLSNMVKRGMLRRIKPGLFALAEPPHDDLLGKAAHT